MLGFKLFNHAFKMLFHDIWVTVRFTILPLILGNIVAYLVFYALSGGNFFDVLYGGEQPNQPPMGLLLSLLPAIAALTFAFIWAAVGWHRYVLLEERPGAFLPRLNGRQLRAYFWSSIRLGLLLVFLLLPILAVVILVPDLGGNALRLMIFVYCVPVFAIWFRYSLILPAAALGKVMVPDNSWSATRGHVGTFLTIALASVLLNEMTQLDLGHELVTTVIFVVFDWLNFALGVSLLTTLYGHFVEERALD